MPASVGVPLDPPVRPGETPIVRVIPWLTARFIFRVLFILLAFSISLWMVYLLRKPIGWVLIAIFLAVALSGPVNYLNQWMRRGFAITIVYLLLLLIPIGIAENPTSILRSTDTASTAGPPMAPSRSYLPSGWMSASWRFARFSFSRRLRAKPERASICS